MFGAKFSSGHSFMNLKIQHALNIPATKRPQKKSLQDTQGM